MSFAFIVLIAIFILIIYRFSELSLLQNLGLRHTSIVYFCLCILLLLFVILFSFNSYAVQLDLLSTSSNSFFEYSEEDLEEDLDISLEERIAMLIDKIDLLLATPSFAEEVEDTEEVEDEELEEYEIVPYSGDTPIRRSRSVSNFRNGYKKYSNMLRFDVTYGNNNAVLLFPVKYEDYLLITDDGYLVNVGTELVTGIMLNGNVDLNINSDMQTQVILNSIMSNNSYHSIKNNGSYSFYRTYYWSRTNGRYILNTRDTYTKFKVTKTYYLYKTSDTILLLILFFCGGNFVLCFLTHLKKY